jgi:poly-gamma-glutamate synthesis protein (capsule biosynthesis protein)
MLDRNAGRMLDKAGPGWPFELVKDKLAGADLTFANLESPIAANSAAVEKPIAFKAPDAAAESLAKGGIGIVSLANNHAMDCGRAGLVETFKALRLAGVKWCGAGSNREEAEAPVVARTGGIRIAFVAFTEFPEGAKKRDDVPTMALADSKTVRRVIEAARKKADAVVASFHWGEEYADRPGEERRKLAQIASQAGADLIIGHHPHVLQGFEVIAGPRRTLVAYSLGNFVFDQRRQGTRDGAFLLVRIGKEGLIAAEAVPVKIKEGRPMPAEGEEAQEILRTLAGLSAEMGTDVNDGRIALYGR